MKLVYLSQNYATEVDDEDYEWLAQYNWYASGATNRKYASRRISSYDKDRPGKVVLMHREIMKALPWQEVDHIDMDTLNNQKSNLRLCTSQQNNCNNRRILFSRGVDRRKTITPSWRAKISIKGKVKYLGSFPTYEKAAKVRDIAALKYYGEFAELNYPENKEQYLQEMKGINNAKC